MLATTIPSLYASFLYPLVFSNEHGVLPLVPKAALDHDKLRRSRGFFPAQAEAKKAYESHPKKSIPGDTEKTQRDSDQVQGK